MAKPEEFKIRIEPDGRIILNIDGMEESSYRRILELLEETVGPVSEVNIEPGDPPSRHIHPHAETGSSQAPHIELDQKKSG